MNSGISGPLLTAGQAVACASGLLSSTISLFLLRFTRLLPWRLGFAAAGSASIILLSHRVFDGIHSFPKTVLPACLLTLFWVVADLLGAERTERDRQADRCSDWRTLCHSLSVMLAAVSATILLIVVCMRLLDVGLALISAQPAYVPSSYGFGPAIPICWLILLVAATLHEHQYKSQAVSSHWSGWCLLLALISMALCMPPLVHAGAFVWQRSGITLALLAVFPLTLLLLDDDTPVTHSCHPLDFSAPTARLDACLNVRWKGTDELMWVAGCCVLVLAAFHAAVPHAQPIVGSSTLHLTVAGLSVATALLLRRKCCIARAAGHAILAIFVSLVMLAGCHVALALLAICGQSGSTRLTLRFAALAIALSACAWLASWFDRKEPAPADVLPLSTQASSFAGWARRLTADLQAANSLQPAAFVAGSLGVLLLWMSAFWPRLLAVSSVDGGLPQLLAGLLAHAALVSAMVYCAHRARPLLFYSLALLSMMSGISFIVIRVWPWANLVQAGA